MRMCSCKNATNISTIQDKPISISFTCIYFYILPVYRLNPNFNFYWILINTIYNVWFKLLI